MINNNNSFADLRTGIYEVTSILLFVAYGIAMCYNTNEANIYFYDISTQILLYLFVTHSIANFVYYFENPHQQGETFQKIIRIGFLLLPGCFVFWFDNLLQFGGLVFSLLMVLYLSFTYRTYIEPDTKKVKEPLFILLSTAWTLMSSILYLRYLGILPTYTLRTLETLPFDAIGAIRLVIICLLGIHILIVAFLETELQKTSILNFTPLKTLDLPNVNSNDFFVVQWFMGLKRHLYHNYNKILYFINIILSKLVFFIDFCLRAIKSYFIALFYKQLLKIVKDIYIVVFFTVIHLLLILIPYSINNFYLFISSYIQYDVVDWDIISWGLFVIIYIIILRTLITFLFTKKQTFNKKKESYEGNLSDVFDILVVHENRRIVKESNVFGINNEYVTHGLKQLKNAFELNINAFFINILLGMILVLGVSSLSLWTISLFIHLTGFEFYNWLALNKAIVSKVIIILLILSFVIPKYFSKNSTEHNNEELTESTYLQFIDIGIFATNKGFAIWAFAIFFIISTLLICLWMFSITFQ